MISHSISYQRLPIHVADFETNDSSEEVDFPPQFQLELKESVVLQESVKAALDDLFIDSQLFSHTKSKSLTVIETPSRVGSKLGQGGFCQVHEYMEDVDRKAIKFLSCTTLEDPQQRTIGTVDLVREAHFLSALQHHNLIRIHGAGSLENLEHFFVVLDRVESTLDDLTPVTCMTELLERLQWGFQIAKALNYLHSKRVVYRDLKTNNIGLDQDGVLKLLDLGLAKELKSELSNGKYRLSGKTGTFRTMAPEVSKGWKYNEKVDTYSFGIVLWELLVGQTAFQDMDEEAYLRRVVNGEERPSMRPQWSPELQDLLQRCWSFFPNARPSMSIVESGMSVLVAQVQDEIDADRSQRLIAMRRVALIVVMISALCLYVVLYGRNVHPIFARRG